jgi:hypothetical protein
MDSSPASPPVQQPPPPPQATVEPPEQLSGRARGGRGTLKKIGYFVGGTVWVVVNGMPVAPVGLIGLLGVISEKRKLATALLVLGGCVLGAIGTGVSLRTTTDPPSIGIHVGIGLHPRFNEWLAQRGIERSGVLDEGKALADKALEAIKAGDAAAFRSCFDPIAFKGQVEAEQFLHTFSDKLGAVGTFEYSSAGLVWLPELKKRVYVLYYNVETTKADTAVVRIGLHKTADGWRLLSISA